MKSNYNNKDLKITQRERGYGCLLCAFNPIENLHWCSLFCRSDKVWIEDVCNSSIFRV